MTDTAIKNEVPAADAPTDATTEKSATEKPAAAPIASKPKRRQAVLFLTCETPLATRSSATHPRPGIARSIAREPRSQYPTIPHDEFASSLSRYFVKSATATGEETFADAQLLVFPLRTMRGVFTWVTSLKILQQFDAALKDSSCAPRWPLVGLREDAILCGPNCSAIVKDRVTIEEYSFAVTIESRVQGISRWLASNILPTGTEYQWWGAKMARDLLIVPDEILKPLIQQNLHFEAVSEPQGIATLQEFLPVETVLYSVLGEKLADSQLELPLTMIGLDQTAGRGVTRLKLVSRANNKAKRRKKKPKAKETAPAGAVAASTPEATLASSAVVAPSSTAPNSTSPSTASTEGASNE